MELRPGLKDVRRPAALMHAYIVLSLWPGSVPKRTFTYSAAGNFALSHALT
jgi:hypothetical protein